MALLVDTKEERTQLRDFYHQVRNQINSGTRQGNLLSVLVQAFNDEPFSVTLKIMEPILVEDDSDESAASGSSVSDADYNEDNENQSAQVATPKKTATPAKAGSTSAKRSTTSTKRTVTPSKRKTIPAKRTVVEGPAKRQRVAAQEDDQSIQRVTPKKSPKGKGQASKW